MNEGLEKKIILTSKTILVEKKIWTRVRVAAALEGETISGLVEKALGQYLDRYGETHGSR